MKMLLNHYISEFPVGYFASKIFFIFNYFTSLLILQHSMSGCCTWHACITSHWMFLFHFISTYFPPHYKRASSIIYYCILLLAITNTIIIHAKVEISFHLRAFVVWESATLNQVSICECVCECGMHLRALKCEHSSTLASGSWIM